MGIALSVLSFFAVRWFARRGLGHAFGAALAIGCFYGIVRAQLNDSGSYLIFDAALLGLYLSAYKGLRGRVVRHARMLTGWVVALCALPVLLILLSPFLEGQPLLVQLLGLRTAMFFVPMILVGGYFSEAEWIEMSSWVAWLALICAVFAVAELVLGVERFFPVNPASALIYAAHDIGEGSGLRIPSTFPSAHAYSGAMVGFVPILLRRLQAGRTSNGRMLLTWTSLGAVGFGALGSGARLPILVLAVMVPVLMLRSTKRPGLLIGLAAITVVLGLTVAKTQQFRRIETLRDPEIVAERLGSSVNVSLLDAITDAPLGYGLGMGFGTSIPYFLADSAKNQIGIESEYARIAIEEGVLGVTLWLGFILWSMSKLPFGPGTAGDLVGPAMWIFCCASWLSGLIGAGVLSSVPTTVLVLSQMGAVAVRGEREAVDLAPKDRSDARRIGRWSPRVRPVRPGREA
jgi:hypothetical protein